MIKKHEVCLTTDHKRFAQSLTINTLLARTRYNAAGEQGLRKHQLVPFGRYNYGHWSYNFTFALFQNQLLGKQLIGTAENFLV